jgi:hypothetical protein
MYFYEWQRTYHAAILETDRLKLPERIQAARKALDARIQELNADHHGSPEEQNAIRNALSALDILTALPFDD